MPLQAKDIFSNNLFTDSFNVTGSSYDIQRDITIISFDKEGWFLIGQEVNTDIGVSVVLQVYYYSIALKGNMSLAQTLTIGGYQFRHGTIIDLNNEIADSKKFIEKYPLVYLMDRYTETYTGIKNKSAFTHSGTYTLYFLTEAEFSKWKVIDYDKKTINQMRLFAFRWIEELEKRTDLLIGKEYTIENIARFAVYYTNKGEEEQLTSEDMSGVKLEIPVSFYKCFKSNCDICQ